MADNQRRRVPISGTPSVQTTVEAAAAQVVASAMSESVKNEPINTDIMVSTGSTLFDLALTGGVIRGGGLPAGILVEMYGRSGTGKSALLMEILGNVVRKGGKTSVQDPEGRINAEYARVYGYTIDPRYYDRPDTVVQTFSNIRKFCKENYRKKRTDPINAIGTDSLAALSTELELSDKGDKMGMRRAKDFSTESRITARDIANSGNLIICTNQVRHGEYGDVTPGGGSIEFYASVRVRLIADHTGDVMTTLDAAKLFKGSSTDISNDREPPKDEKNKKDKSKVEKILGIKTNIVITKSSIDDPYREAFVYIMFGYGIDDIRANLQWVKNMTKDSMYEIPSGKRYLGINQAVAAVEAGQEEPALREKVIDMWGQIEEAIQIERVTKKR
jgi:RecA/RadA recombinase